MANTSGIKAGRAYIELGVNSKLDVGLKLAQAQIKAFSLQIKAVGADLLRLSAGIVAPFGATIKMAADANETLNKFSAVFRTGAAEAGAFAEALAGSVGRSSLDLRDAMSAFQAFGVGLGFSAGEAEAMSRQLTALALDFASFHNLKDAEAVERFISAMSGSVEVVDRFGINLHAAAIEQQLLASGIRKSVAQASEQEKVMARLAIITRAMAEQGATGDAVRTAGGLTNQLKALAAVTRETAVSIGNTLVPVVTPLVRIVAQAARSVQAFVREHQALIIATFGGGAAIGALGGGLISLGIAANLAGYGIAALQLPLRAAAGAMLALKAASLTLLNPLGLVAAGVAAAGVVIAHHAGVTGKVLDYLRGRFAELSAFIARVMQSISASIAAGDVESAARVMWLTLKLAWQQGAAALNQVWLGTKNAFLITTHGMFYGAVAASEEAFFAIQTGWLKTKDWMIRIANEIGAGIGRAFGAVANEVTKLWIDVLGAVDSSIDTGAAKRLADKDFGDRIADFEAKQAAADAKRQTALKTDLSEAERLHEATLAEIGKAYEAEAAQQTEAADKAAKSTREGIARARAELEAAIRESKTKTQELRDAATKPAGALELPALPRIQDLLASKIQTVGTFNAAAVAGLGADVATGGRIASATEETALQARRTAEAAREQVKQTSDFRRDMLRTFAFA